MRFYASSARIKRPPHPFPLEDHFLGSKVLVTGATGFIGSHLVQTLVALGADVTALGTSLGWRRTVRDLVEQQRVQFIEAPRFWDSGLLADAVAALGGMEYVVHLAYSPPRGQDSLEDAMTDAERNVLGTLSLVQRLPESVSKICFASSVMVYGPDAPQPVAETHCARPATVYAAGKLATETYLRLHVMTSGRSLVILRYATAYGPMETVPRAIPNFIRQVLAERSPVIHGTGDDVRDYVHVQDIVDATLLALAHQGPSVQVFNVGTGQGYTTREVAERIIRLAGKPMRPLYQPRENPVSKIVGDISRARKVLGYEPQVTLDDGLCEEIRYFSANPQLWRS